jgi:starch-binding outer membrane protein, SusD/RagB family
MKIMKKLYLFLLVITTIALMEGCESVLDLAPVSSVTEGNYWKTPEQFQTFITGIHNRLRTHTFTMEQMGEFRSDLYGETSDGSIVYERWHLNTLNATETGLTQFGGFYTNINQINLFIAKTLPANLLTSANKNYYLGQAYGMRAFYYFHLLRSWGDVVLTQDPSVSFDIANLSKPASPATEVMKFIKQDIDSSAYHFANDYSFRTKVIWSKAATLMLQAEVYLWSAKQMGGGTADAAKAKAALTEIQTNIPALGLLPNFKDVFAYANKDNKEIIFAIRSKLNEYTLFGGNYTSFLRRNVSVTNYYDSIGNRKLNTTDDLILTVGGAHYVSPHTKIFRQFSNSDSRKLASIRCAYSLVGGQYVKVTGCWVSKYQGVFDLGLREMVDDWPIYRYADLLLMLAEAKSMLGENPATEINLVRQRAYAANYQVAVQGYPNQPIDADINEALLKERLFEFICEGKRWYDLRRFGKSYVFKYTTATADYQLLWPIDLGTLTNNRALVQNPGY